MERKVANSAGGVKSGFERPSNHGQKVRVTVKRPDKASSAFGTVWRRTAPVAMDQPFAYIMTGSVS